MRSQRLQCCEPRGNEEAEDTMSAPFIFVSTNRLKEGKRDAYANHLAGFVPFVQEQEPQLLAFYFYLDEEGEHINCVQVHPDPGSMLAHMQTVRAHVGEAYEEYLDETVSIQIFGEPSDDILTMMQQLASDGVPISINRVVTGFDRLSQPAPTS
jgi:hypothetical protein